MEKFKNSVERHFYRSSRQRRKLNRHSRRLKDAVESIKSACLLRA